MKLIRKVTLVIIYNAYTVIDILNMFICMSLYSVHICIHIYRYVCIVSQLTIFELFCTCTYISSLLMIEDLSIRNIGLKVHLLIKHVRHYLLKKKVRGERPFCHQSDIRIAYMIP